MSLADAIIEENIPQIRQIIYSAGINLNQIDEYGFTPLIEAAIADNAQIAQLLIDHGADPNFPDSLGGSALHWAAENNNIALARLLLLRGADPNTYNLSGQSVLVMPLLRQQQAMKKLLIEAGANLIFAQDFINAKFLGHLFELVGTANIISPKNEFVEVDFEGFFLEVTLALIAESLGQFQSHFAGRKIRQYNHLTATIVDVLNHAASLIKYQQYRINLSKHIEQIDTLIQQEPLVIPIGYEGHAITFVKFGAILVKADRREDSRLYDNVVFYHMQNPERLSPDFIKHLLFEKHTSQFINEELPAILNLQPITELKVSAQISGNCSWANVEACIPVLFFLLFSRSTDFSDKIASYKTLALDLFHQWRDWSKDRALNFCIQTFKESDSIRKACKAEILAAIFYQYSQDDSARNLPRMESIAEILKLPEIRPILQNYIKSYAYEDLSEEGKNFLRLLKSYGIS
jgi:hypothetical protein